MHKQITTFLHFYWIHWAYIIINPLICYNVLDILL